ncbi:hypothetical protein BsWGS_24163 [Bradybaena similaris]
MKVYSSVQSSSCVISIMKVSCDVPQTPTVRLSSLTCSLVSTRTSFFTTSFNKELSLYFFGLLLPERKLRSIITRIFSNWKATMTSPICLHNQISKHLHDIPQFVYITTFQNIYMTSPICLHNHISKHLHDIPQFIYTV